MDRRAWHVDGGFVGGRAKRIRQTAVVRFSENNDGGKVDIIIASQRIENRLGTM